MMINEKSKMHFGLGLRTFLAIMIICGLAVLFTGNAMAQYDHTINDPQNDVYRYYQGGFATDVDRPNVDITQIKMSESGDTITITMKVKGTITDSDYISYVWGIIDDKADTDDDNDAIYTIGYTNGYCMISGSDGDFTVYRELSYSGIGTDTLSTSFSLSDVNNSAQLEFWVVTSTEDVESEDDYYQDPIVIGVDGGNGGNGKGDGTDGAGFPMELAIAGIIILVVVVLFFLALASQAKKRPPAAPPGQPPAQPPVQ